MAATRPLTTSIPNSAPETATQFHEKVNPSFIANDDRIKIYLSQQLA